MKRGQLSRNEKEQIIAFMVNGSRSVEDVADLMMRSTNQVYGFIFQEETFARIREGKAEVTLWDKLKNLFV